MIQLPTQFTEPKAATVEGVRAMILFGPPKVGKTTFAAEWPDSLLVECEPEGADYVRSKKVQVNSMEELREVFKLLATDTSFKTIVIDTLDQVAGWIEKDICKELGIANIMEAKKGERNGSQWGEYKERVMGFVLSVLRMNRNVIFLCHAKKVESDGNGGILNPKTINIYGSTAINILSMVNNIGYMFAKEVEGGVVKRYLTFKAGNQVEAGSRHPALRDKVIEIPREGGYKAFEVCFKTPTPAVAPAVPGVKPPVKPQPQPAAKPPAPAPKAAPQNPAVNKETK